MSQEERIKIISQFEQDADFETKKRHFMKQ